MPQLSMRDAINQALHQEMERDPRVIVLGEDVSGGAGGTSGEREAAGGIFGITKGLLPKFGEQRVIDTPISESAIIGAAGGAALAGLRPVAEIKSTIRSPSFATCSAARPPARLLSAPPWARA
jgi:pyruvate/2-oxoglutarate/acetoin dehydrogenase E1 component